MSTPPNIPHIPPKVVGYCRACGKGLDETSVRTSHGTIYCEEHIPPMTIDNPQTVPPVAGGAGISSAASPYANPYTAPHAPPLDPGGVPHPEVSPGLAFLLGIIPGVGAIYNRQYAKGIVHVVIVGL